MQNRVPPIGFYELGNFKINFRTKMQSNTFNAIKKKYRLTTQNNKMVFTTNYYVYVVIHLIFLNARKKIT